MLIGCRSYFVRLAWVPHDLHAERRGTVGERFAVHHAVSGTGETPRPQHLGQRIGKAFKWALLQNDRADGVGGTQLGQRRLRVFNHGLPHPVEQVLRVGER